MLSGCEIETSGKRTAGFRATFYYRLGRLLSSWLPPAAIEILQSHAVRSTGADISAGAEIGPGLVMKHPVGVVIGHGVRVGKNCTILQGVTLGERLVPADDHSYPVVGSSVTLCAHAVVVGGIRVGNYALIAANSVVINDVEENAVAAGLPASTRKQKHESRHAEAPPPDNPRHEYARPLSRI